MKNLCLKVNGAGLQSWPLWPVILLSSGCQAPSDHSAVRAEDLRKERSWQAVEAAFESMDICTDATVQERHVSSYSLCFPVHYREEWTPDSEESPTLLFEPSQSSLDGKEPFPSVGLAKDIKKDFVYQNSLPAGESNLLPWVLNQVHEFGVPLISSPDMESLILDESQELLVGVSEVGFSDDFSDALVFVEIISNGGAAGEYILMEWSEKTSVYEVVLIRLAYHEANGV
jgi:hypothetical protein